MRLPKNQIWKQNNYGDRFDDLWATFNVDLTSKLGKVRISPRLLMKYSSADDADFGIMSAIANYTTLETATYYYQYAIAGNTIFRRNLATGVWSEDTYSDRGEVRPNQSDICPFNGYLYFTSGSSRDIHKLGSNASYTELGNIMVSAAGLHQMAYLRSQNRLYFVDSSSYGIRSLDISDSAASLGAQYTLTPDTANPINWIEETPNQLWIGCGSKIYVWDGSTATGPNETYIFPESVSLACTFLNNAPVVLSSTGRLYQFNGGSFIEIDRFPNSILVGGSNGYSFTTNNIIHFNGMKTIGDNIVMLVRMGSVVDGSPTSERVNSGIWIYTKETGLHHAVALSRDNSSTTTDFGQPVFHFTGYVGALQGTSIGEKLFFQAGAAIVDTTTSSSPTFGFFETLPQPANDFDDSYLKQGHVITSRIFSSNLSDTWQKLHLRLKKLMSSDSRVFVKYRISESKELDLVGTWVSQNSFTVSWNIMAESGEYPAFTTGDEVTIMTGVGGAKMSDIVSIAPSGGDYLVTMRDNITGITIGDDVAVQLAKWKSIGELSNRALDLWTVSPEIQSPWIQFKIILRGKYDEELDDIILTSKTNEPK
jgi:hypothetical protein